MKVVPKVYTTISVNNVWFQKVSILPPQKVTGNFWGGGGGGSKAKLLKEKYETKLEFPGG